jgi:hypothetical protein
MRKKTKPRRILMVGILIAALWSPAIRAGADSAPDQFAAVLGPFPIEDNPCTGASGLTLTAYVDVTLHLFGDQAGHEHFTSVWNGTAVTSDGFSGRIQLLEIGQPDAKGFAFRASAQVTDGTDSYVIVGTSNGLIVEKCITPPASEELIFAVAYTDVDANDGGYNPTVDRLIAKLVDANIDGVPSAGDLVITGEYPMDFEATTFGQFEVQQFAVTTVLAQSPEQCGVESDTGVFLWDHQDQFLERYLEAGLPFFDPSTAITDGFETAADDHIGLNAGSPSQPTDAFSIFGFDFTDQAFIDIELNCH